MIEQIVALTLEPWVRLLLDLELDVTWLCARYLVTLPSEAQLGPALHALVHMHMQHLALDDRLLGVALLAFVLVPYALALAVAVGAHGLEALDHGTHLPHHRLHTLTITTLASLHCALLATSALALGADDALLQRQLAHLSSVDVFQRHFVHMVDRPRLLGASIPHAAAHTAAEHAAKGPAAATEELREQVLSGHAAAHATATFETLLAVLVVELALVGLRQDLVCFRNLLELVLGFLRVLVLVWVPFEGALAVGCLELLFGGVGRDAESVVVGGVLHHLGGGREFLPLIGCSDAGPCDCVFGAKMGARCAEEMRVSARAT